MVKILFIIPYKELGLYVRDYIERCTVPDIEFQMEDVYGNDISLIQEYEADIVVARGMSGEAFRSAKTDAHHIEIPVTSYDILNVINDVKKKHEVKRIAFIWTHSVHLELVEEILGISISQYIIKAGMNPADIMERVEADGTEAVIGGLTIGRFCKENKIPFLPIVTTKETLKRTLDEAVNTASGINGEKRKTNLMKTLLNNSKEAICVVDTQGKVQEMNLQFYRTFEVPDREEMTINEAIGEKRWWEEKRPRSHKESIQKIQNKLMLVVNIPIEEHDWQKMYLLSFQDAEEIRSMEYKIRNRLKEKGLIAKYRFENILGHSQSMRKTIQNAQKYSQFDSNVLILGESGTGKELFAQSIHNASERSKGPFVAVNCAAMPEQLLESELFGYSEGSFTGASKGGKAGLFEQAHKGTLFLDEIGEMPPVLQAKLLRVLQEHEVRRLGDNRIIPIDVRVICATNVKIDEMIQEGKFRLDLYYRINLFNLVIPPLRERENDIQELFISFVNRYSRRIGMQKFPDITEGAAAMLMEYDWPGNVRELQNFSERVLVLCDGQIIDEEVIRRAGIPEAGAIQIYPRQKVAVKTEVRDEEQYIQALTKKAETKAELAKRLGISRSTLYRRMKNIDGIQ